MHEADRAKRGPKSFARIEPEKNLMHVPDGFAHGGNRQAGNRADDHGQHNHTRFPRAHDGAQTARHFELAAEQAHGEQFNQAGNATGLNAMTLAGASDGFQRANGCFDCRAPGYLRRVFGMRDSD